MLESVLMQIKLITKPAVIVDNIATGALARTCRKERKLSLRTVAKRLKLTPAYVSDLELGRRGWREELIEQFRDALWNP